MTACIIDSTK